MSTVSASIVWKQGTSWPLKALIKNKRKKEKKRQIMYMQKMDRGKR